VKERKRERIQKNFGKKKTKKKGTSFFFFILFIYFLFLLFWATVAILVLVVALDDIQEGDAGGRVHGACCRGSACRELCHSSRTFFDFHFPLFSSFLGWKSESGWGRDAESQHPSPGRCPLFEAMGQFTMFFFFFFFVSKSFCNLFI